MVVEPSEFIFNTFSITFKLKGFLSPGLMKKVDKLKMAKIKTAAKRAVLIVHFARDTSINNKRDIIRN